MFGPSWMRCSATELLERLRVGVGDDEIDAFDLGCDHVGDGVAARAADADHGDPRAQLLDLRADRIDAHCCLPWRTLRDNVAS